MLHCLHTGQGLHGLLHALAPNTGVSRASLAHLPGITPAASMAVWTGQSVMAPSHQMNLTGGSWGLLTPPSILCLGQQSPRQHLDV